MCDKDFTFLLKAHGWQSEGKTVTVAFPFQREDSGWSFDKILKNDSFCLKITCTSCFMFTVYIILTKEWNLCTCTVCT